MLLYIIANETRLDKESWELLPLGKFYYIFMACWKPKRLKSLERIDFVFYLIEGLLLGSPALNLTQLGEE